MFHYKTICNKRFLSIKNIFAQTKRSEAVLCATCERHMTFSQSVKNEILKSVRNIKGCCATSFLTAAVKSVGSLTIGYKGYAFSIESDNPDFLTLCQNLSADFNVDAEIETYNLSAKGAPIYSCKFDGAIGEKLGLTSRDGDGSLVFSDTSSLIPTQQCCKRAFLQGLFVSCGSVVIPANEELDEQVSDRSKYHLELRFTDSVFAEAVKQEYAEIDFRTTPRKNYVILYLKDSEKIADFLVYVNATTAKLKLENVIVLRSVRNAANRQMNCTVANIEKSVAAASKQLQAINILRQKGLFDGLPDNLKEIALLREKYKEANLDEIADMLKISKSGANHRFAKLIELAKK